MFSFTVAMASAIWPAATSRIASGIWRCAGQARWQTEMQSPRWSLKSSSSAALRAALTSDVSLATTMPSVTFVEHDGTSRESLPTFTTHAMHDGRLSFTPARKQSVGMFSLSCRAASRIVLPAGTVTG